MGRESRRDIVATVDRVTRSKILNVNVSVSTGMSLRLAKWLGTSPDLWIGLQTQYDLWQAASVRKLPKVVSLKHAV